MMWSKESIRRFVGTKRFAVAVASVLSAASGSAGGYLLAKSQLQKKYSELSEREIRDAKEYYELQMQKEKVGEYSDPTKLAEKYETSDSENDTEEEELEFTERDETLIKEVVEISRELKYHAGSEGSVVSDTEKAEVSESIRHNIFDNREPIADEDDGFNLEEEKAKRDPNRPYIISYDEYFENEEGHSQTPLSWFDGDDVLTDDKDAPIRDVAYVLGVDTLKFGHGSGDANVVFVRNEKLQADYEVTRSFGKYAEEVLGYIEHSDKPRPRKFRTYD